MTQEIKWNAPDEITDDDIKEGIQHLIDDKKGLDEESIKTALFSMLFTAEMMGFKKEFLSVSANIDHDAVIGYVHDEAKRLGITPTGEKND